MSLNRRNTVDFGREGENFVCERLKKNGYKILARNIREKFAEIDIVALDGDTLAFIEVRTRDSDRLGPPAETVTPNKQRHIRRAAEAYLVKNRITDREIRFDVATVIWQKRLFEYFRNAF